MDKIRIKAYGKINIALDVISKRSDGYHEVRMIMQKVGIYDSIEINKIIPEEIRVSSNLYYVPSNEKNLAYKAAKLLIDKFNIKSGVKINLKKYIPVSAGMAGGSADAAAVMQGINKMFGLKQGIKELKELAVKIGADVPYCLMNGTALAEGIGEQLTPINSMPKCHILIAKPRFGVSTKQVYQSLDLKSIDNHPDIDAMICAINNKDIKQIASNMGNVLESVTIKEHPKLDSVKEKMILGGALNSMMSGSGPAVFGIFDSEKKARQTYYSLKKDEYVKQIYLTKVID